MVSSTLDGGRKTDVILLNSSKNVKIDNITIRRGIGMYILDSDLRPINQGDVIVLPPKLAYSFCSKELGDEYNINLTDAKIYP